MRMQTPTSVLTSREEHVQDMSLYSLMVLLGGNALFSKEVPPSTCEAEVRIVSAMVETIKVCVWIDKVLDSLGLGENYRHLYML